MIMRLERTSEEVKTRARHVIICDNYPEKHRYLPVTRKLLPIVRGDRMHNLHVGQKPLHHHPSRYPLSKLDLAEI